MARKLPLRELAKLPSFEAPSVSWQKDKIAFFGDETGRMELYVIDTESGDVTQISRGQLPKTIRMPAVWSRDGRFLFTLSDDDGDEQFDIYSFDVKTHEFAPVTQSSGQNYALEISPSNAQLLFISTRNGQMNLFTIILDTKEMRQLTNFANPVFDGTYSPNDEYIYFSANESEDLRNMDVYRLHPETEEIERFWRLGDGSREQIAEISPDGRYMGVSSDYSGIMRSGVMDLATSEVWWLGDNELEERSPRFSPDSNLVLTTKNNGAVFAPRLYDINLRKPLPELDLSDGFISSGRFLQNEKIFFVHSDPTHRKRMLVYDRLGRKSKIIKDAEYGSIDRRNFATAEYVSYESFDGKEIFGILWKPKGASVDKPVPAVVFIHGGPGAQDFLDFSIYIQAICSAGFSVFQPNYRSSSGYGKEFLEANLNDWGGGDLKDITHAGLYLKTVKWIDGERISVAGGSYGGYLTYMAAVKAPELWNACVAWVGITDLNLLYESSMTHFRYFLRYFMGDPDKNRKLWEDRSAITHAKNFKGPLLIAHGISDPRCPIEQARVFRDKLAELGFTEGREFEYVELGEQGHGSNDPEQKARTIELLVDFLERRAK